MRIEDLEEMAIEIVTISCAGECADVEAVAHGGNPPYTFEWEDGSTSATRELCPDETTSFEVTATDTAVEAEEFSYAGAAKVARVTANVLDCNGDGGRPDASIPSRPENCIDLEHPNGEEQPWEVCPPSPELRDPFTGLEAMTCSGSYADFARVVAYSGVTHEQETLGGVLCAPLTAGEPVQIALALGGRISTNDPFVADPLDGTTFALDVWAGGSPCDEDELLWGTIDLPFDEIAMCISFTPERDHTHIFTRVKMFQPSADQYREACLTVEVGGPRGECE